ncbi:UNVERIFIED_CONTAM: hypothetical protein GTU68_005886 [Idotea baltica]|nr:hypothetical protein [Idotea baltica]
MVVLIVVTLVVSACGSASDDATPNQQAASPSETTDSLPGQTSSGGDNRDRSTTSLTEQVTTQSTPLASDDQQPLTSTETTAPAAKAVPGAARFLAEGFSDFSGQRVGLIASRASVLDGRSVIDLLAESSEVDLVAIFTPEHGLRADGGAGEVIADEIDPITGLPVFSLYGNTRQPTSQMLDGVDVLLFDLQDVGARYYTYTATMGLAMQAAARGGIPFVVLDRPNPLGGRSADGALREPGQESFVSQYPTPALHGMTTGELALAVKGQHWLSDLDDLDLRVMELANWNRADLWADTGLAAPPSPGLPTAAPQRSTRPPCYSSHPRSAMPRLPTTLRADRAPVDRRRGAAESRHVSWQNPNH